MRKGSNPGRGKRFTFPLLHNIQNILWDPPSLIINGRLRHETDLSVSSSMNEGSYTSTPLISPAGMHKRSVSF
jgi:hypothetical protein